MTSETFPYGMTATYVRDQAGETTAISYVKTGHCVGACPEAWFSETIAPSIDGETLSRANTLTGDSYAYDAAGRLTETGEEPVGKGCALRIYAYNEDSNRTSLTTREPGMGGKCATEGGANETHTYDTADRLDDPGISYDPLGNTTKLPASDAGGHELTSTYYVDGQVEKQNQNGQENLYYTDPAGRIRKTVAKGTTNLTAINHYAGSGEALSWKDEGEGKYTRLIPGIDGTLCATQANGGTPVLQLHDLQGDVVGTVPLTETETKLQSTYNSTEFGVPVNGPPPTKYSWLGAAGVSSELSSGTLISGTVAYQPQLGRPLQTQPVTPPGMAINGAEGQSFTAQLAAWYIASSNATAANTVAEWAATQKAREEEACEKAPLSCSQEEDPIHHYRAWEANKLAEELRAKVKEGGLIDFLGGLFNLAMGPEATLDALFGRNIIEEWALAYASYLETCTDELHRTKHSHGGCRAAVYDITIFGLDTKSINFNRWPTVSWCEGMSQDTREVHWCHVIQDNAIHGNGSPL